MLTGNEWTLFLLLCLTMSLTPGPNMLYLSSRALCQGTRAAVISLGGTAAGFVLHTLLAATGVSALLRTTPLAFEVMRYAGAAYFFWLAWKIVRPGSGGFQALQLPAETPRRLFVMGFTVNALNPQAVLLYLSIFTQFVRPERGPVFAQGLVLGGAQLTISAAVNLLIICAAGGLSGWFARKPGAFRVQRVVMGGVLSVLALRLVLAGRL
jgi:threonine/homoserine/homoserine lactone efflux protein